MIKKWLNFDGYRRNKSLSLQKILESTYGFNPASKTKNKTKIDLILQDGKTSPKSSAFIRLLGPLTCSSVTSKISLNIAESSDQIRKDCAIVIVQRTVLNSVVDAKNLTKYCKDSHKRLIVDTDDAFFDLEPIHPNYDELHRKHDALLYLVKNADQVWVSTENLKRYYSELSEAPVHVVRNTLDGRLWAPDGIKDSPTSPLKMIYMGTATHNEDFEMIIPWLDRLYENHPHSFELHIVGISSELPDKSWLNPIKRDANTTLYPNFAKWIQTVGPFDIGIAPLVDSKFNSYKSDIKCLDYLAIGALPMVSNNAAYGNKELNDFIIRNPNNEKGWTKSIETILRGLPEFRKQKKQKVTKGQNYLREKRSVEITASKLIELLSIT